MSDISESSSSTSTSTYPYSSMSSDSYTSLYDESDDDIATSNQPPPQQQQQQRQRQQQPVSQAPPPQACPFPGQENKFTMLPKSHRVLIQSQLPPNLSTARIGTLFKQVEPAVPTSVTYCDRDMNKPLKVLVCGRTGKTSFIRHFVPSKVIGPTTWPELDTNDYYQFVEIPFGNIWDPILVGYAAICDIAIVILQGDIFKPEHLQKYIDLLYMKTKMALLIIGQTIPIEAGELSRKYNIPIFRSPSQGSYPLIKEFLDQTKQVGTLSSGQPISLNVCIVSPHDSAARSFINALGGKNIVNGRFTSKTEYCKTPFTISYQHITPNSEVEFRQLLGNQTPDVFLFYITETTSPFLARAYFQYTASINVPKIAVFSFSTTEQQDLYQYEFNDQRYTSFFFTSQMSYPPIRIMTWFMLYPFLKPLSEPIIKHIKVAVMGPEIEDASSLINLMFPNIKGNYDFSEYFPTYSQSIILPPQICRFSVTDFSSANKPYEIKASESYDFSIFCCSALNTEAIRKLPDFIQKLKVISRHNMFILSKTDHPAADIVENDIKEIIKDIKSCKDSMVMTFDPYDQQLSEQFLTQFPELLKMMDKPKEQST